MILSLSGLICQVQIIYCQYMSDKTLISLEIGRLPDETPPAITVCYPGLFSMERAAKFNADFTEINKIYQDFLFVNDSYQAEILY